MHGTVCSQLVSRLLLQHRMRSQHGAAQGTGSQRQGSAQLQQEVRGARQGAAHGSELQPLHWPAVEPLQHSMRGQLVSACVST